MAVPAVIAAIRLGQVLYRVSTSPAAQALAKKAIEKYGGKIVKKTTKELKGNKYITEKVLKQKDPTIPQQIGGRVNRILGKGKDSVITKKSPGVNKSTAGISGPRQAAEKTGRAVIGGTVAGVPAVTAAVLKIKDLKSDLKKAKTAEQRAKLQTRIEKEVAKVKAAEQKAKDKGDTKSRTENRNTRRGSNMKVPQGTRVPTSKPGVKRSLRPQLRPKK